MRTTISILAALALTTACNQPPGAAIIAMTPDAPTTTDELKVEIVEAAIDPNEDIIELSFEWTRDGQPVVEITGNTVPAGQTTKGEVWQVTVTPRDDKTDGIATSAQVTIANTPPTAELSLTPDAPRAADDLQATVDTSDADRDDVTVKYTWTKDGAATGQTGATVLGSETERGQTWQVTIVPNDGQEDGEPQTASVVIQNIAPVIDVVTLAPSTEVYENTTLAVTVASRDDDGDELDMTYTWSINGVDQDGGPELTGADFDKGNNVAVTVTANDGFEDSNSMMSETITVLNTPPVAKSAAITPTEALEATTLTCEAEGWSDADGDKEGWRFQWEVNGVVAGTDATLNGSVFNKSDVVQCFATPWDGEAEGNRVSSNKIKVGNTAPTLASATLSTLTPKEGDTLTVTLGALADDDGDKASVQYVWKIGGKSVATGATLDSSQFKKSDVITCDVTPFDGTDFGKTVTTSSATVANTAPAITMVSTSPKTVRTADSITTSVTATDLDGDKLTFTYAWTVNSKSVSPTTAALASTWYEKGDVVVVAVTANDGADSSVPVNSSPVTIADTELTAPVVTIDPESPKATDDLFCEVTTASTDDDDDKITYTFSWTVDGKAHTGSTITTDYAADTIPSSVTTDGQEWKCTSKATAGGVSKSVTDSVSVGAFRGFNGKNSGKWQKLATPKDNTYSLQTYGSKDIALAYNMYASNPQVYNAKSNTWSSKSSTVPYKSAWTTMAPVGTDLWMIRNRKIYKYDTAKDVWTTVTSWTGGDDKSMTESDEFGMVYGHDSAGRMIIYNTKISPSGSNPSYVTTGKGAEYETRMGYDPDTRAIFFGAYNTKTLYKYDIVKKTVTTMASHPESQLNDIYCSDRSGHIYAAGGRSGNTMYMYDVGTNKWGSIAKLPSDHGNNGSCYVSNDGYLYVGTGSQRTFYRLELY